MIEDFEKALCTNGNLECVARRLTEEANKRRQEQLKQIQYDLDFCKLIRAGLTEQPETGPYMIARAYVRMYRKKHFPGGDRKLEVELLRDIEVNQQKGDASHERNIRTGNNTDGGADRAGESMPEGIPTGIPSEAS